MLPTGNPMGSIWHRWDPHIHTPETIFNDQFTAGQAGWDEYVDRINESTPVIKALGVTDYFSIENYEKVRALFDVGRFSSVEFIFPNIELRFNIGTAKNNAINGHLLVSPEDPNHVHMVRRFLNHLSFTSHNQHFTCNRGDLILLGRMHKDDMTYPEGAALREGSGQFKVDIDQLIELFAKDQWAQTNILFAISVQTDGTGGLSSDASFATLRKKFERHAQIMFTSSDSQRKFWLGKGSVAKHEIINTYGACKPCIHGSDAHEAAKIGMPDGDRYTWIKGDLNFESLRQVCIEPETRVIVATQPPINSTSSAIEGISVTNSDWFQPESLPINSGMVAIIGSRGSGKTALADLIAAGAFGASQRLSAKSFIHRAWERLSNVQAELRWTSTHQTSVDIYKVDEGLEAPAVQYLTQQFVDDLCSAEGATDELLEEVERVIFNAHPENDRVGMENFGDFLATRAYSAREKRRQSSSDLERLSSLIAEERNKKNSIEGLKKTISEKTAVIEADKKARGKLIRTGQEERQKLLAQVNSALIKRGSELDRANRKVQALKNLISYIASSRATAFPNYVTTMKQKHADAGLSDQQWQTFSIDFNNDVDGFASASLAKAQQQVSLITGSTPISTTITASTAPFIGSYDNLDVEPFNVLKNELKRLELVIGVDAQNNQRYSQLNAKIDRDQNSLSKLQRELDDASTADERIAEMHNEKRKIYKEVFDALLEEEEELKRMYEPLQVNLASQAGSLRKLAFQVKRKADMVRWAEVGEELIDTRTAGDFRGNGALLGIANSRLKKVWETGSSDEIAEALSNFRKDYDKVIVDQAKVDKSIKTAYNEWGSKVTNWLYSTDHISIEYSIQYDGVDIQQLSPGTRGIVLLLLYLAVDQDDDRPLIIDQPEENLDPNSVFSELTPLFTEVRKRRQVIIVTHNANLVVNADADQVIVATAGAHRPGQLPVITYASGGLENPSIRKQVCDILEGGEEAFKERARRLRVTF